MMSAVLWLGFVISLSILMIMARRNLWLGFIFSALSLGLFTLTGGEIAGQIANTLTDTSVLLLALAVGVIPMIGGAMEMSGLMEDIVNNLRVRKKLYVSFSPALVGMLPMPGGALLSAPLIKRAGDDIPPANKCSINIWYRHVLYLIYPLGTALIASTKIAGLNIYVAIIYLSPAFLLTLALGYIFLLRNVSGKVRTRGEFERNKLVVPLSILLVAPLLDLTLTFVFNFNVPEVHLVIAVLTSLLLAFWFGNLGMGHVIPLLKKMRPWRFSFIIIGMFLFLNIFKASSVPGAFAELSFSKPVLLVIVGALLGFSTGRIQLPATIIIPIYFSKYTSSIMEPVAFAIMYFSIFLGYAVSPVHPCVSVTIEYFKVALKDFLRTLAWPAIIGLAATLIFSLIAL